MNDQLLQNLNLDTKIHEIYGFLAERIDEVAKLEAELAVAEIAYKRAYAIAYRRSNERSHAAREREATDVVMDEWAAFRNAEAVRDAAKEATRAVENQLKACQTLSANVRRVT